MSELQLREAICEVGHLLWQGGLINGRQGVITARLSANKMLCTPSGQSKARLRPKDLFVVPIDAKSTGTSKKRAGSAAKKPSNDALHPELLIHQEVYRRRPDCNAVVQALPPITTSFSLVGEDIPDNVLPEAADELGSVASVPFSKLGSQEAIELMRLYLSDHKTFVLSHHGALALGKDVYEAFDRIESLESVARIIWNAKQLGEIRSMSPELFDWYLKTALNSELG